MFFLYKNFYFKENFKYYYIITTKTIYYGEIRKICKNKLIKHGMGILSYKNCGILKKCRIEITLIVFYMKNGNKKYLKEWKSMVGKIFDSIKKEK